MRIKTIITIITLLFTTYLLLITWFYFNQNNLVFFPKFDTEETPEQYGLNHDKITFKSTNANTIHAIYFPINKQNPTVLYCHGNYGNITYHLEHVSNFTELGLNVLVFDYSGYGKSTGKVSEENCYQDAQAAYNYLKDTLHISPNNIILFGHSLGAAIASHLAISNPSKGLILEAPFKSIKQLGAELHPYIPVKQLCHITLQNSENLPKINIPTLIFHSTEDKVIPYHHSQTLIEKANEPKLLIPLTGNHGNSTIKNKAIFQKILKDFIINR
jgi:uncharacterized protein